MSDNANGSENNSGNPAGNGGEQNNAPAIAWLPNADPETVGYVQNKKWSDPGAMLTSYKHLETMVGAPADQVIRLPKEDTPEAWSQVFDRLGRPKTADDYEIPMPEQGGDEEYAKSFKAWAHELGLSTKQAKALAEKNNEYIAKVMGAQQETSTAQMTEQVNGLKKEWGQAFEQNSAIVEQVADKFGMDENQLLSLKAAMGPAGAMKFLHNIGTRLGEDAFVGNGSGAGFQGALTPGQAQAKIAELRGDPTWVTSYLSGDPSKVGEMRRLQEMANAR
jgi:hypothetical protein